MPDLTITNVRFPSSLSPLMVKLAEPAAAFDILYTSGTNVYSLADATSTAKAAAVYMTLLSGIADEFVPVIPLNGSLVLVGPTLVQGTKYVVSASGGKVAPRSDLISGNIITELFDATDSATAQFSLNKTGISVP